MTDKPKNCGTCIMRSDAINTREPDICYEFDKTVRRDELACSEWKGSLRDKPLEGPPVFGHGYCTVHGVIQDEFGCSECPGGDSASGGES